jgi:ApbE superfamily uncharacterized protein (UPF0280 family)
MEQSRNGDALAEAGEVPLRISIGTAGSRTLFARTESKADPSARKISATSG